MISPNAINIAKISENRVRFHHGGELIFHRFLREIGVMDQEGFLRA
jgi:hypothetical protein